MLSSSITSTALLMISVFLVLVVFSYGIGTAGEIYWEAGRRCPTGIPTSTSDLNLLLFLVKKIERTILHVSISHLYLKNTISTTPT